MTSLARFAKFVEQAKWPFPREEMIEPGAIVLRMIEDLEALAMRDAPMTVDALVAMGWPQSAAARFFPSAYESAAVTQSIVGLLRPDCERLAAFDAEARLVAPPPANDDEAFLARDDLSQERRRAFLAGVAFALCGALLVGLVIQAAWSGLP
jgi:hypothetical protein